MENHINSECIEAVNDGRDIPARIKDFSIKYTATDGWRGYYSAIPTKKSGWIAIDSDWVSGNWDDAGDNASDNVEAKMDKLLDRVLKMGGDLIMVVLPTSNVFSTAYDVFVKNLTAEQIDGLKNN